MNIEDFKKDLIKGEKGEKRVAMLFFKDGWNVKLMQPKSNYDLRISKNGIIELIEVKNEDRYFRSGNICIETYQGNPKKPSGLETSQSTIFIHTLESKAVIYGTNEMREYFRDLGSFLIPVDFKEADNKNGGFIKEVNIFLDQEWFDYCNFEDLVKSKIIKKELFE